MRQKLGSRRSLFWILRETTRKKVDKLWAPALGLSELGWRPRGNHKDGAHGMDVGIWRLSLCELNRRDSQRPYVGLEVVPHLLDHLRSHPERSAYHCMTLPQ